jgi:hypothetical protein
MTDRDPLERLIGIVGMRTMTRRLERRGVFYAACMAVLVVVMLLI